MMIYLRTHCLLVQLSAVNFTEEKILMNYLKNLDK